MKPADDRNAESQKNSEELAKLSPTKRALLESLLVRARSKSLQPDSIPRQRRDEPLPLSFAQQRLWLLQQLDPDSAAYHISTSYRLRGKLDSARLERSLNELVRRHESLRTTYRLQNGNAVQVIAAEATVELPLIEVGPGPEEQRIAEVERLAYEASRAPFRLEVDLPLRCRLLRLADDDHVLVMIVHHVACDGWSLNILLTQLGEIYQQLGVNGSQPRPVQPIEFADFAVWQRESLDANALSKQRDYWMERMQGAPAVLELPTDFPRPAVETFNGGRARIVIPHALVDKLKELCHHERSTLYMTLLGAFQTLLSRYSGQEDIVVGSPISGRNRVEVETLVGCFINTLLLRTDLSGDPTFRELLARVRDVTLDAYAHQEYPFERLVEELKPDRQLSHSPLFQVLFVLQNMPKHSLALPGVSVDWMEVDDGTAQFDLSAWLQEKEEGLRIVFEYNTDLFRPETMARMVEHYRMLLEAIVSDPDRRLSELSLLTEEERRRVLVEWNRTELEPPSAPAWFQMFEARVAATPDAPAAIFGDRAMTYRELNAEANRLARHLQSRGMGRESLVGICLERSLEMHTSVLAVGKAGGTYVPLDPAFPEARLSFMLADSGAQMLITQTSVQDRIDPGSAEVVCVDTVAEQVAAQSDDNLTSDIAADSLAYVIYTSGSTGKPKGVQIPHAALVNFLESMRDEPGLCASDRLLAVTTLSFDIAGLELLLPLIVGSTVVIASSEASGDGRQLAKEIERHAVTVMQATPATWRLLLAADGIPAGLRVLCGGEPLPADLARKLLDRNVELWNMYGPTETTVWSTVERITSAEDITIGRPIRNTQVYVLDKHGQPVPIGVPGELYIGGEGVARGYLNRPELTGEKFLPDPFSGHPGARFYRTGDVARWRDDGRLQCFGRTDHQVKIRGYRIELGEIETALNRHADVREAAVIVREDTPGDKRLVAYVVGHDGRSPSIGDMRDALQADLPDYMVPSAFVLLEAMPLTPNGKIDRRALPAPGPDRPDLEQPYVAPSTPIEEIVAEIWSEVFHLERIGVNDNFFELGGHSLLATQVVSRIGQMLNVDLPLRILFESPTVSQLAVAIVACYVDSGDEEVTQLLSEMETPVEHP